MVALAVTTTDNPYDPFDQFEDWNAFDEQKGYYTSAYLARVAQTSPEMSPNVEQEIINDAAIKIVKYNTLGIYKIVTKDI